MLLEALFVKNYAQNTSSAECNNILTPYYQMWRKLSSKFAALKSVRKIHIKQIKKVIEKQ